MIELDLVRRLVDAADAVPKEEGEVDPSVTLSADDGRGAVCKSTWKRILVQSFGLWVEGEDLVACQLCDIDDAGGFRDVETKWECG